MPHNRQHELILELLGTTCRCGRPKRSKQTFCRQCYYALPREMQWRLYLRLGYGYEEAYDAAVQHLRGDDPHGHRAPGGVGARERGGDGVMGGGQGTETQPIKVKLTIPQRRYLLKLIATYRGGQECEECCGGLRFAGRRVAREFLAEVYHLPHATTREFVTWNSIVNRIHAAIQKAVD